MEENKEMKENTLGMHWAIEHIIHKIEIAILDECGQQESLLL